MRRPVPGLASLRLPALVFAAVAAAAPAYAADIAPAPAYAPPPVYRPVIYNWTGIYFGGHVGAGLLEDSVTYPDGTQADVNPFAVLGGGQIGAQYQFAPWVIGVEGMFTVTDMSGSTVSSTALTPAFNINERATSAVHWYATATARAGYAVNDLLFYAKGGAAWMGVNYTQDILTNNVVTSEQVITDTRVGWTVGAGIEYGMTENLSAKVEYDFLDFGSRNYNFNNLTVFSIPNPVPVSISSMTHMFTVGLNYRFNWGGGGALAAQY
jgi:outer membrane immunogenic protein